MSSWYTCAIARVRNIQSCVEYEDQEDVPVGMTDTQGHLRIRLAISSSFGFIVSKQYCRPNKNFFEKFKLCIWACKILLKLLRKKQKVPPKKVRHHRKKPYKS